jgi:hypothetical protein
MQPSATKQQPSEADFDRTKDEAFSSEGGAPKPDQDTPAPDPDPREGDVVRPSDHRYSTPDSPGFPARRSGYPNNRIKSD